MTDNINDNTLKLNTVARANDFCVTVENVSSLTCAEFVAAMLRYLPALYADFNDMEPAALDEPPYAPAYMDEDYYDSIRRSIETVMGADDVFLETFVEDMKYSDTPVGVSVAESIADIFQDLYNFVSMVKDTDGDMLDTAIAICHDNFISYWSQTLCNVLRPLNYLHYHPRRDD